MKILVTGAEGFIGTHLCRELRDAGHDVIGIDFRDGDLTLQSLVFDIFRKYMPEVVVHLAAQVGITLNEEYINHSIDSNVIMAVNVARATASIGARMVHTSTSEVYGEMGDSILDEDTPLNGKVTGIYALSKRWSEEAVREYCPNELTIIRPSMPYGPGAPVGKGRRALDNMLWQAHHGLPVIVHRGAVRSWCWINDTVRGWRMVIESGIPGIYNIGRDDDERSMEHVAFEVCRITGAPESLIKLVDPPVKKTMIKRLSTEKLRSLGWQPITPLSVGMPVVYEWVKRFDIKGVMR